MAGQKLRIHHLAKAENTWLGKSWKNKAGQQLKKQGWEKAEKTRLGKSWKYKRRPHIDGRPSAALYHMVIQYVVSACIFSFCPALFFQLLPSLVFSAFAQISISGQLGPKNLCIFSFPVVWGSLCTPVILTPGACGRGGLSSTCWHHFRGLRGQMPKSYMLLCFTVFLTNVSSYFR